MIRFWNFRKGGEKERKETMKGRFIVGSIRERSTLLTTLQLFDVSQVSKSLFYPDAALDGRWNSEDIIRETMFERHPLI